MLNPCSLCQAECCKTYNITVTAFDVIRAAKASGKAPADFALLIEPRLLGYDPDMVLDTADGYGRYLLAFRSHPCVFLDPHDRCTIHLSAPLSCRRYPFMADGRLNTRFCPLAPSLLYRIRAPDIPLEGMMKELELHKGFVRAWNRKGGTRSECLDFLIDKASGSSF